MRLHGTSDTGVLLLDQSYELVGIIDWRKAFSLLFSGKAEVLEESARYIKSPSKEYVVPKILRLIRQRVKRVKAAFTKKALYIRDHGKCCYCEKDLSLKMATVDHVVPSSKGGETGWKNCCIACRECNFKKGNKSLSESGLVLKGKLSAPSCQDLVAIVAKIRVFT